MGADRAGYEVWARQWDEGARLLEDTSRARKQQIEIKSRAGTRGSTCPLAAHGGRDAAT